MIWYNLLIIVMLLIVRVPCVVYIILNVIKIYQENVCKASILGMLS